MRRMARSARCRCAFHSATLEYHARRAARVSLYLQFRRNLASLLRFDAASRASERHVRKAVRTAPSACVRTLSPTAARSSCSSASSLSARRRLRASASRAWATCSTSAFTLASARSSFALVSCSCAATGSDDLLIPRSRRVTSASMATHAAARSPVFACRPSRRLPYPPSACRHSTARERTASGTPGQVPIAERSPCATCSPLTTSSTASELLCSCFTTAFMRSTSKRWSSPNLLSLSEYHTSLTYRRLPPRALRGANCRPPGANPPAPPPPPPPPPPVAKSGEPAEEDGFTVHGQAGGCNPQTPRAT